MLYEDRIAIKPHIYRNRGSWCIAYKPTTSSALVTAATCWLDAKRAEITAEQFEAAVGHAPEQDDLDRCNCPKKGQPGHLMCGWDALRNMPMFIPGDSCGTPSN